MKVSPWLRMWFGSVTLAFAPSLTVKGATGVVALIGVDDGKASVVVGVTEDLTKRINSVDLVRVAVAALGGKGGGGRPDMAQGGGPNADQADAAL